MPSSEKIYVKLNKLKVVPVGHSSTVTVRAKDNCVVDAGTNEGSEIEF